MDLTEGSLKSGACFTSDENGSSCSSDSVAILVPHGFLSALSPPTSLSQISKDFERHDLSPSSAHVESSEPEKDEMNSEDDLFDEIDSLDSEIEADFTAELKNIDSLGEQTLERVVRSLAERLLEASSKTENVTLESSDANSCRSQQLDTNGSHSPPKNL